jgi:hypothetical protein
MTVRHQRLLVQGMIVAVLAGCARWRPSDDLPSRSSVVLDQLVVFSDTPLPQHHRLLEDLRAQRTYLSTKLGLPVSDEPIHVYLFPTAEKLEAYMRAHFPGQPQRRAFFVESDTRLSIYAFWGDRVAEDLRHEVAHGYLHALVPNLPLWLDEGLAEYFEVPRGLNGLNRPHVDELASELTKGWHPDLERLEHLRATSELTQAEYAESWAWAHFLLETSPERLQILRAYLQTLAKTQQAQPLSDELRRADAEISQRLMVHLAELDHSLR